MAGAFLIEAAFGSAFAINELGARAQGMGGAFTSIADDGSALFYNPAGIAFQKGLKLEMDSLVVVGLFRFFPSSTPPGAGPTVSYAYDAMGDRARAVNEYKKAVQLGDNYDNAQKVAQRYIATPFDPKADQAQAGLANSQ